jgi:channel protein (hemolysin III family)
VYDGFPKLRNAIVTTPLTKIAVTAVQLTLGQFVERGIMHPGNGTTIQAKHRKAVTRDSFMEKWYSIGGFNDPMSSISHLTGLVVFFVLSIFMLRSAWNSRLRFWFSFVYAFAVVLMLSMSFVYHMFEPGSTVRAVMVRLDVASIFILIAATFTSIHGILFTGWKRWGILTAIWTIAVTGLTLRTIFFDSVPGAAGIGIFLAMGWIGAFSAYLLYHDYGWSVVKPVIWGGIFYSVGAIIDAAKGPILIPLVWGSHESFHLFVLAGLGMHWSLIAKLAEGSLVPFSGRSNSLDAKTQAIVPPHRHVA